MFDIYEPNGDYRGSFDDKNKAIGYAMRHNFIVINRRRKSIEWTLYAAAPVYAKLGVR